jgi:hypothetical protein
MRLRSRVRSLLPRVVLQWLDAARLRRMRRTNAALSTREVFTSIYERGAWGSEEGRGTSGSGSTRAHASEYAGFVKRYIDRHAIMSIVDLGCGDFVVGSEVAPLVERYIGADIVEDVITRNQRAHSSERVSFQCLDMSVDPLPPGDLCLVRQVLQHLSNAEIAAILPRLRSTYRHILISEHSPAPSVHVVPNLDKPHGGDTRILDDSAVVLDAPPFSVPAQVEFEVVAPHFLKYPGETIRTWAIRA